MSKLAQSPTVRLKLRKSRLMCKLWPNGEMSIYAPHRQQEAATVKDPNICLTRLRDSAVRAEGVIGALDFFVRLGLSHPRNFDKNFQPPPRKGLKGITSLGKRRVRNAAFMLTRKYGKRRLTFATVTLPSLTPTQMSRVHKEWHRCIDFYRREMSRQLERAGLTGEIVGVTEIQEKRYATTSLPVLHGHFVFCGATRNGWWAISPSRHDHIWRKSIEHVLGEPIPALTSACQLKSVTDSAEAYLGKYISKGIKAIEPVIRAGYAEWMPKQWWSCSRSLVQEMELAIARFESGAGWLVNKGKDDTNDLFAFFSPITIETKDGNLLPMGYFARLTPKANSLVRKVLSL